jgi:DNA polymerase-3 subunit epsilon
MRQVRQGDVLLERIDERDPAATAAIEGLIEGLDPLGSWARMPMAVMDVETTGLNPENDRVIELGVVLVDGGQVGEARSWLVQPGIAIPKESLDVHGIADEELRSAPSFAEIREEFLARVAGRLPVAYNARFDRAFLRAELRRTGDVPGTFLETTEWVDPLVWARALLPNEGGHTLARTAKRFEIELASAHRAAADAEATARVLLRLAPRMPTTYVQLVRGQRDLSRVSSWVHGARRGPGNPSSEARGRRNDGGDDA